MERNKQNEKANKKNLMKMIHADASTLGLHVKHGISLKIQAFREWKPLDCIK